LNINQITGQISPKNQCSNINEVLIRCYDVFDKKKNAYAKIIFDQICQENSAKQSNIDWINKIGEERRKRIHYEEPKKELVRHVLEILTFNFRYY
jgi:hypothetical protein